MGSLCEYLHRGKTPKYSDVRKYPVFAQKCNQPTHITLEKVKFADPTSISRYGDECYLRDDDIVVNSTGAGTLGRVGLFHETILGAWPCIVPDSHVTTIRCVNRLFAPYVYRLLKSPVGQWLISSKQTGSTNQKELPATEVARFLVPVPPIKEQRRISTQTEVTLRALGV
ncbi:restriction endonuclease subunit S [Gordonibacter massiliensis (ex Traore et al. 2017)]|uniref:restriction endonuclease subunit S n=1 Tax=Gordonibacter massiliensis (ex Traore et al. 2017) TaxID=1841863 RepID=UPI0034A094FE